MKDIELGLKLTEPCFITGNSKTWKWDGENMTEVPRHKSLAEKLRIAWHESAQSLLPESTEPLKHYQKEAEVALEYFLAVVEHQKHECTCTVKRIPMCTACKKNEALEELSEAMRQSVGGGE